ncbi:Gfo/Idh/MocA family oxidoreductase [Paenibacillus hemerocallicola]|uniref:Gfo/Idh/MocA family oxidoreductase n=2 Tax=Paenibacillus hemerocallicola TaxID=1172614 RepID=A0A5C4TH74_9BACL|nr:Gfo/Idh/MocA family oxidoreductase [Paenibacillus hemerocallicola]
MQTKRLCVQRLAAGKSSILLVYRYCIYWDEGVEQRMKVRIGVIGVGGQGKSHIDKLLQVENAEVASVYDVNRETAERVAREIGATAANSSDELLDSGRIDAVIICAPQFAREGLEETAAARGIHLMAEKPLGLDLDTVRAKAKVIREAGVIHAAGYCLRYLDTVQRAKKYLESRPAHMIQVHRIGSAKNWPKWMRQQHLSGGNMVAGVTHQIDLVRFLGGEFRQMSAQFNRLPHHSKDPEDTIIDSGAAAFTMESGSIGTIGESVASLFYSNAEVNFIGYDYFLQLSSNGTVMTIVDENGSRTEKAAVNMMYEQSKAFVDAVANNSQELVLSSYTDAVRTMAVTIAATQSAEDQTLFTLQYDDMQP